MITINDFKPIGTDVLETSGELTVNLFNGERTVGINYSSILTRLIQEAGSRLLGFYDSGVDEANSVLYWYNETSRGRDHYSAIWRLDIDVELVAPGRERIGMKLYRVR